MFRPRLNRVFRSRWSALWWAACILLTAWRVAAGADSLVAGATAAPPAKPASDPWALDPQ